MFYSTDNFFNHIIKIIKKWSKKNIAKSSIENNLINKYYSKDINSFINLFKELTDKVINIKTKMENKVQIFKNSSSIFEDIQDKEEINNSINIIKNNLIEIFELIENKNE